MATIAKTLMTGVLARPLILTTMTASDTFTFEPGTDQILHLRNVTAGALTVVIDGAGGTVVNVPRLGPVSVAAGYSTGVIAAGAAVAIPLDTIEEYLQGVITLTGGTGIVASLTGK